MTDASMTKEQKAFIAECEEEFKDRYTEKDEKFMQVKNTEQKHPPIMDPWYNKPPRNYDWSRQNHGHEHRDRRGHGWKRHDRYDRSNEYNDHHQNYKRHRSN